MNDEDKKKRKGLSKAIRFEVFKRDKFSCQYCGAKSPETLLHVDHINPVAAGGENEILNLITSCEACNLGKSDKLLSDDTVVSKKHSQLSALQERKEQIEMMSSWQMGLADLDEDRVRTVQEMYQKVLPGWMMSAGGLAQVRAVLTNTPLESVLAELRSCAAQWARFDESGKVTKESSSKASEVFLNRIKYIRYRQRDPVGSDLRYIRGIVRNCVNCYNEEYALDMLEAAYEAGVPVFELKDLALRARNWTMWRTDMEDLLKRLGR